MKKKVKMLSTLLGFFLFLTLHFSIVRAAPMDGEEYRFKQPDGTYVDVKVYGDEFYQRVESVDGHTLIRDPQTQYICYAKLNENESDFESTGVIYQGAKAVKNQISAKVLEESKGLKLNGQRILEKVKERQEELGIDYTKNKPLTNDAASTKAARALSGTIRGLTIVIEFPQGGTSSVPISQINDFLNKENYAQSSTYRNNGSVWDYFYDVSGGKVDYKNVVFQYTAQNPKSYYDRVDGYPYTSRDLVLEALAALAQAPNSQQILSSLTLDPTGDVAALNVFYAGSPDWGWTQGLWPHSWDVPLTTINGVSFKGYQISDIGTELVLGTFAHENGHMLFGFPDAYDYTYASKGLGDFCLMAYGGSDYNPVPPSPYMRKLAGWGESVLNNISVVKTVVRPIANDVLAYRHQSALSNEYFMMEYVKKNDRYQYFPGNGVAVYHIDEMGNNDYTSIGTATQHALASIVSASGRAPGVDYGSQSDLFPYFNANGIGAVPDTRLWNGGSSGFSIRDITPAGEFLYVKN